MRLISIPLVQDADGLIVYEGKFADWSGANIVGDKIVGYYAGALFLSDGVTKAFPWQDSDLLGRTEQEQIKAALTEAVQAHLDATAQSYGYDSIYTAVTYADEPAVESFQKEGQALRAWRSLVWVACHQVLADVMAGKRGVPSSAELIAELPAFTMPA